MQWSMCVLSSVTRTLRPRETGLTVRWAVVTLLNPFAETRLSHSCGQRSDLAMPERPCPSLSCETLAWPPHSARDGPNKRSVPVARRRSRRRHLTGNRRWSNSMRRTRTMCTSWCKLCRSVALEPVLGIHAAATRRGVRICSWCREGDTEDTVLTPRENHAHPWQTDLSC